MKLTIDGTEVEAREGASVLDAALDAGVFIPHICKHPDLEAVGGCRLCSIVVDGEGPAVPACKTPVREGMVVDSHAKAAEDVRRMAMELILATHPSDCTGCPKYGVCELQSMYQYLGVSPARWRCRARTVATDDTNPLITHMFTRCIRCGRCVRACRELRGVGVLDYQRTPEGIRAQVETLTARGQLTAREAQAVDTASLLRLGQTPLGAQLAAAEAAGTLRREFRFSLLCPAETFFPGAGDEQVLLQGVVDAWFETKDGLVIVDYKTDRIRPEGVPARTAYYAAQLRAYAGAMARITGRPVCRRVLYFLHCGRISDVPGPDA